MFRFKTSVLFVATLSLFACKTRSFNKDSSDTSNFFGSSNEKILPIKPAGESYLGMRRSDAGIRPSCAVVSNGSKWEFVYNLDAVKIDGKIYPQYPEGELAEVRAFEASIRARGALTKGVDDTLLRIQEARIAFAKQALKMKLGTNLPTEHRYKIGKAEQESGQMHYWFEATNSQDGADYTCYLFVPAT
jgi:hypothetical protein